VDMLGDEKAHSLLIQKLKESGYVEKDIAPTNNPLQNLMPNNPGGPWPTFPLQYPFAPFPTSPFWGPVPPSPWGTIPAPLLVPYGRWASLVLHVCKARKREVMIMRKTSFTS